MDDPRGEPPSPPRPVLRVVNPDEPAPEHHPTAQHHRRAGNATLPPPSADRPAPLTLPRRGRTPAVIVTPAAEAADARTAQPPPAAPPPAARINWFLQVPPAIIKLASRRRSLRKSRRGRGARRDGRPETEAGPSGSGTNAPTSTAGNNENSSSSSNSSSSKERKGKDKGKDKGKEVENEDENKNDDNGGEEKRAPPLTPTKRLRPPMPENVPAQESEHAPRRYQPYRPETFTQAQAQQQRQEQQRQQRQQHSLPLPPPPPPTPTPLSIQPITRPKTPSIIHELFPNGSISPVTNPPITTTNTDPTRRQGVPPPPRPQSISTISYFTTQPPQRTDAAAAIRFPFTTTASTAAAAAAAAASLPPHRIYRPNRWLGERTGEDRRAAAAQEVRDGLLLADGSGGRTTKGKLTRAMLWFCLALGPAWGVLLLVTSGKKRKV